MRVALAQLTPCLGDKAKNVARAEWAIRDAAARAADVVLFPELFLAGYFMRERTRVLAEPLSGPSISAVARCAGMHHVAVVMGFPELGFGGNAVYDSACVIDNRGEVRGCYRKIHLFGEESRYFAAGNDYSVVLVGDHPAGIMICYDVEFPEVSRILALRGAHVLLVSSANMKPFETYQEVYLRARALENHAFVALVNRVGSEEQVEFFGESNVCDPLGHLLCRAEGGERLLFADIDLSLIARSRETLDYLSNRRPELYTPLASTARTSTSASTEDTQPVIRRMGSVGDEHHA